MIDEEGAESTDEDLELVNIDEGVENVRCDSETTHEKDSDIDSQVDIYNMRKSARKVTFGAPARESEASDESSHGVHTYGRGAEHRVSEEKKKKNVARKKQSKESSARAAVDLLESDSDDDFGDGKRDRGVGCRFRRRGRGLRRPRRRCC